MSGLEPNQRSVVGLLDRCTVRIETDSGGVGTGFFFAAPKPGTKIDENGQFAPLVITNNHVIGDAKSVKFVLTATDKDGHDVIIGCEEDVSTLGRTKHPNGLDLTSLNISQVMHQLQDKGLTFAGTWLDASVIPTRENLDQLEPLCDVVMIGYPSGIWDRVHNKPVFRRGIAATSPGVAWNGSPEFLIDVATYGGSSGSPVFVFNEGAYSHAGSLTIGNRLILVGITRAVMLHTSQGEIRMVDIPTQQTPVPVMGLPNNLGVCISVTALGALIEEVLNPSSWKVTFSL
jgi:hypothetical protein